MKDNIQSNAECINTTIRAPRPFIYMHEKYSEFFSQPTDLLALSVRGGVVCDLEVAEVEDVLHLIVVSPPLTNNGGHVKQKDVSGKIRRQNVTLFYCTVVE